MNNYDNSNIRRQDRILEADQALTLLLNGEYGFLAMSNDGSAYGIPISYIYSDNKIYLHCAPEGEKLRYIEKNPSVCFCVVGSTMVQPAKFTTAYESVLAFGDIVTVDDNDERMKALELLVDKYSPEYKEIGLKYAKGSFSRTTVLRIDIKRISGKSKRSDAPSVTDRSK